MEGKRNKSQVTRRDLLAGEKPVKINQSDDRRSEGRKGRWGGKVRKSIKQTRGTRERKRYLE